MGKREQDKIDKSKKSPQLNAKNNNAFKPLKNIGTLPKITSTKMGNKSPDKHKNEDNFLEKTRSNTVNSKKAQQVKEESKSTKNLSNSPIKLRMQNDLQPIISKKPSLKGTSIMDLQ